METKKWITPKAVCDMFDPKPSEDSVRKWMRDGLVIGSTTIKIKCHRVGKRWYTTADDVNKFQAECETANVKQNEGVRP